MPLLGFGCLMLAGAALLALLGGHPVELALEGGVGLAAVACAGALALRRRPSRARAIPMRSGATALLATGVALTAFGAEVGQWLLLIGAGLVVAGLAGLVAERRRA